MVFLKKAWDFVRFGWIELILIIPVLLLSLDEHKPTFIYDGKHPFWVQSINKAILPSLCLLAVAQLFHAWDKYKINRFKRVKAKLENDLDGCKEAHKKILHEYLSLISKKCNFEKTERVSLYKFTPQGFKLIGRQSESYKYETSGRGGLYPLGKGIIAKAWDTGEVKLNDLPDSVQDVRAWVNHLYKLFETPVDVLEKLHMKSRCYYAKRINNGNTRLAVIVIESMRPRKISQSNISHINDYHLPQLISILDNLDIETVNLDYARSEGF